MSSGNILKTYTVCFLGHRSVKNPLEIERKLYVLIRDLMKEKEYVEFILGRSGEFDNLAASVVRFAQNSIRCDNSELVWMQYQMCKNEVESDYDRIEICEKALKCCPEQAIIERNKYMIDRSDMVISYLPRFGGDAYQSVLYAWRRGKQIHNVAEAL